jgi:hypothetical protein
MCRFLFAVLVLVPYISAEKMTLSFSVNGQLFRAVFSADGSDIAQSAASACGAVMDNRASRTDCEAAVATRAALLVSLHEGYGAVHSYTPRRPTDDEVQSMSDVLGGLQPGDAHYKSYVGHPDLYGEMGALQFSLLFMAGLRDTNTVLEVGCGSLRLGRMLLAFLNRRRYRCLDPNAWLHRTALRYELGEEIVRLKQPYFSSAANFSWPRSDEPAQVRPDFLIAQSIFSHTGPALLATALRNLAEEMGESSILLATFVVVGRSVVRGWDPDSREGGGWVYPDCVLYSEARVHRIAASAGLHLRRLDYPHPKQQWYALGKSEALLDLVRTRVELADKIKSGIEIWRPLTTTAKEQISTHVGLTVHRVEVAAEVGDDVHEVAQGACSDLAAATFSDEAANVEFIYSCAKTTSLALVSQWKRLGVFASATRGGAGVGSPSSLSAAPSSTRLDDMAGQLAHTYASALPFPHIVLDGAGVLPAELVRALAAEFPPHGEGDTLTPGWGAHMDEGSQWKNCFLADEELMGPAARTAFGVLRSSLFVRFLQRLTGIEQLIPDPHLHGAGLQQTKRGGVLNVHAADVDIASELGLFRRASLFVYLNEGWKEAWGGALDLWDDKMEPSTAKRILPILDRMVIFSSTCRSRHGYPAPVSSPPGVTRRSIVVHYYTAAAASSDGGCSEVSP